MKLIAFLFCALALWAADALREGNFTIRFEPFAKLQTNIQVPFTIDVKDALQKPLTEAKVTMRISMADGTHEAVYKGPSIDAGVYMAKPVFPVPGSWNVEVKVKRDDAESNRTIQFNVPE